MIKAAKSLHAYWNERDTYLHLKQFGYIGKIGEFNVPQIRGFDDALWVVEMDYMLIAPYLIDFGKVRLLNDPQFSPEALMLCQREGLELFGENWPRVERLLRELESCLVYYLVPRPGNIVF